MLDLIPHELIEAFQVFAVVIGSFKLLRDLSPRAAQWFDLKIERSRRVASKKHLKRYFACSIGVYA